MARHQKRKISFLPAWVLKEKSACLRSVAEDAYFAKELAALYGASKKLKCQTLLRAAEKSLRQMESISGAEGKRCSEGDRAARKFWEAKVCARGSR